MRGKRRQLGILSIALLLVAGVAWSQQAAPEAAAFNQIGSRVYSDQKAPGFAMLVWSHGRVVYARGYGFANLAERTPATPQTRFVVGSITKQFTTACVLLLAERGKLSLDDSLAKYFPEVPNAGQITLRMLLNQVTGLHNYPGFGLHPWPKSGEIPPKKLLAFFKIDRPDFAPGTKWEYSNTNYALLAMVVAKVSHKSYNEFLQRNIFDPLGINDSGEGFKAQRGTATPYVGTDGDFKVPKPELSLDLFHGAGSIVSTADDMAKWDAALIGGRLLNADSMHLFWSPGALSDGTPTHYAMGFVPATIAGHREVWHNGFTPDAGGYCYNAIFPDDQLAVVVLSNASDKSFRGEPEHIVKEVLALYDPKIPTAETAPIPAALRDNPAVNAVAIQVWRQITSNTLDRALFTPQMNAALTPEVLAQVASQIQTLGALRKLTISEKTETEAGVDYIYDADFENGAYRIQIFLTRDGKIGGYRFMP